jgi:CO/xanthine dehydrogenase Mo-binding subunit
MSVVPPTRWCGQSIERVEDAALLTGRGRFIDDLGVKSGTLYGAILRSPHAHARITAIGTEAVRNSPGVAVVLVGKDITALSASLVVGIKAPIECWPIAVDRVRYIGEPVAVVVANSRCTAEDALELIEVDYEPLPAIVDPLAALDPAQPTLHDGLGFNVASERSFRYGDPERAFADAARRVSVTICYPRNSGPPLGAAGSVPAPSCAAMRLLHRRHADVARQLPARPQRADRSGVARISRPPFVPLHRLCAYPNRGDSCRPKTAGDVFECLTSATVSSPAWNAIPMRSPSSMARCG